MSYIFNYVSSVTEKEPVVAPSQPLIVTANKDRGKINHKVNKYLF